MSRKVGSHFAYSKQIKYLVVILLTLNKAKNLVVILLAKSCLMTELWSKRFKKYLINNLKKYCIKKPYQNLENVPYQGTLSGIYNMPYEETLSRI